MIHVTGYAERDKYYTRQARLWRERNLTLTVRLVPMMQLFKYWYYPLCAGKRRFIIYILWNKGHIDRI